MIDLEQESLQIRRTLPPLIAKSLEERGIHDDQVVIATDTDLDITGEYSQRWVVVTKDIILVYMMDEDEALILREMPFARIETARTDSRVGSGFLEVKTRDDVYEEIVRFSNKNAEKFTRVASRVKQMAEGKQIQATDDTSTLGRCQRCGVRLLEQGNTVCPRCVKRGLVFMRFLARTKAYWPQTATAMVLVLLTIFLSLAPPQLTRVLLDNVFEDKHDMPGWFQFTVHAFGYDLPAPLPEGVNQAQIDTHTALFQQTKMHWLAVIVGMLAVTFAFGSLLGWMRERLAVTIAHRLAYDLRRDVFTKMEDLALRYYDTHPVGSLMTRASQDIEVLQGFINQLTAGFGYQIVSLASVTVVMFAMSWQLALIATIPAAVVVPLTVVYTRRILPLWRRYWTTRSNVNTALYGSLSGIRVVKAFAQEKREAERFNHYSGGFRDSGFRVGYSNAWFYPTMGFLFQTGGLIVWFIGGYLVLHTQATTGMIIAFLGYLGMFYAPLNSLTQMSTWFTQFTTQAHRVFEVLDQEPEITERKDAIDIEIQGTIEFKNVTFGYDPNIPVLHDVSFIARQGEMIGIVGHSGSGKSTTVNLITRFYDPREGQVLIDNVPLTKIRKNCLRRQIGIVLQDSFLFRGTVAENISYGNPDVSSELMLDASLAANAHMFIVRNPDGYDTRLGESGSGLSGGERQRVAIARALLHNPRILILDEATSSVDTIAEREIQRALEGLSLGRTVIAIAHRLSTLRNCDRIIVFEEGHIREMGTHEELLVLGGIYKRLVEIQTQLTGGDLYDVEVEPSNGKKKTEAAKEETTPAVLAPPKRFADRHRGQVPHIHYLDPKDVRVYSMVEGAMRVVIGSEVYNHVRAYRCFPISRPSEFIAFWTGNSALEHEQIGVIRHLRELAPSSRLAVEHELSKRYFIHYILKINAIKEDVGFLTWEVDTDKGPMEFITRRFERYTVVEGGNNGRIIQDVDNNRYEIENMDELDAASRAIFQTHIFW